MEVYFRRFFIGHLLVLLVVALGIIYLDTISFIGTLIFAALLEFLFYYVDSKHIPKRKEEITRTLRDIFNAEPYSKGLMKFKVDHLDLFAETIVDFKLGLQIGNIETVNFHIPKNQLDSLPSDHGLELVRDNIDGLETYCVYRSSGSDLTKAMETFRKLIYN